MNLLVKILIVSASAVIVFAIAWGGQKGQVRRNTGDIAEVKATVDANKTCIVRMETKLESIEKAQIEQRTEMKNGFIKLEGLIKDKHP